VQTFLFPYITISIWLQVIPRERILFVKNEELRRNSTGVMREIYNFLNLSPLSDDQLAKPVSKENINEKSV